MNITGIKILSSLEDDRGTITNEAFVSIYAHAYNSESKELSVNARIYLNKSNFDSGKVNFLPQNKVMKVDGHVFADVAKIVQHDTLNEAYRQLNAYLIGISLTTQLIEE